MITAVLVVAGATVMLAQSQRNQGKKSQDATEHVVNDASGDHATARRGTNQHGGGTIQDEGQPLRVVSVPEISTRKDRYDKLLAIATAALVAVGFLQIVFLWRTVKATQDNAEAARASAEALINSERAWVMVDIEHDSDKWADRKVHILQGSGTSGNTTSFYGVLVINNEGKSPAWIDETRARFEIVEILPDEPNLESLEVVQEGPEAIGVGRALPNKLQVPWIPTAIGHQQPGKMPIIYGITRYRDIFDRRHQTFFGYRITPAGEFVRLENKPKYNKTT